MKADALLALRSYTIKRQGDQFFVAPTAQEGRHRWSKPYDSLQRATTAIARKLQREFVQRHKRLNGFNGRQPSRRERDHALAGEHR